MKKNDNSGALFPVKERASDKHPNLSGKVDVAGKEWFVVGWTNTYEDLNISEEYNALGEAAKLMTLLNLYQDDEEYEKCAVIKNRMDEINKILKKFNK